MAARRSARGPTRRRGCRPSARPLAVLAALALGLAGCTDPPADDLAPTSSPSSASSSAPGASTSSSAPTASQSSALPGGAAAPEGGPPAVFPLPFPTAALAEVADGDVDAAVRAEVAAEHIEFLERAHNRGADSLTIIRAEEGTWTHVVGTVDGQTPMTTEHQVGIGALGRVVSSPR